MSGTQQYNRSAVAQPRAVFKIRVKVWLYPGFGGWHFVRLTEKRSAMIRALCSLDARPFGSIPVTVSLGRTQWKTSIFPDKKSKSYMLALKADIRHREHIEEGDTIVAEIRIL